MGIRNGAAILVVAAGLAGCQVPGGGGSLGIGASDSGTLALSQASDDYRRTVGDGVALGAVAGGIAGALIGGARGDSDDMVRGALIGTLVGGALGGLGGTAVAENKRGQIASENRLDAEIAAARAANGKLRRLVAISRRLVAQRRAEAAALRGRAPAQLEARRALLAGLRANQRTLNDAISRAEGERARLRTVVAGFGGAPGGSTLSRESTATTEALGALRREREALGRIEGSL